MIPSCSLLVSASSSPHINLTARAISASRPALFPPTSIEYNLNRNGTVVETDNGGSGNVLENWISDPSYSRDYEARATLVSGTDPTRTNLWIGLDSNPSWTLTNDSDSASTISCVLKVEIREVATGDVKATASITMSAIRT